MFVDVTANTYTAQQMLEMEMRVMEVLKFCLVKTTALEFVELMQIGERTRSMVMYLVELATLQGVSLRYSQSVIVVAGLELADTVMKTKTNFRELADRVNKGEWLQCFKEMCQMLGENRKEGVKAVTRKYCQAAWHNVGKIKLEVNQDKQN